MKRGKCADENRIGSEHFIHAPFILLHRLTKLFNNMLQHSYFGTQKFEHRVEKCRSPTCSTCQYLEEGDKAFFPNVNVTIRIKHRFSCDSGYLLYKLTCQGCNGYYIGRTTCLKERLANHKIKTNNIHYREQAMYKHIFLCAKNEVVPFKIMPYEKLHYSKISEMATVERHHIDWLRPGLNTM